MSADLQRAAWRAQRRYDLAKLVMQVTSLVMLAVVLSYLLVTSARIAMIAENGKEQRDRIESCTTPGRTCYERSQAQTRQTITSINDVTTAAAACGAAHPGDVKGTKTCVEKAFAP